MHPSNSLLNELAPIVLYAPKYKSFAEVTGVCLKKPLNDCAVCPLTLKLSPNCNDAMLPLIVYEPLAFSLLSPPLMLVLRRMSLSPLPSVANVLPLPEVPPETVVQVEPLSVL